MFKTCFLTGNHDAGPEIYAALYAEIERHIVEYGVQEFFVGYYGKFDMLAIRAVNEAQDLYEGIGLTLVMHYLNKDKYDDVKHLFTDSVFPDGLEKIPPRYAITTGNRMMVNKSDYLIVYARDTTGNTGRLLEYARRREKRRLIKITQIVNENSSPE